MNAIYRFFKDESGATAIEYGLIAALMAVIIIAAFNQLSEPLKCIHQHWHTVERARRPVTGHPAPRCSLQRAAGSQVIRRQLPDSG